MLGRQPVVDREHLHARVLGEQPAGLVVGLQIADHEAAAVEEDQQRVRSAGLVRNVVAGRQRAFGPSTVSSVTDRTGTGRAADRVRLAAGTAAAPAPGSASGHGVSPRRRRSASRNCSPGSSGSPSSTIGWPPESRTCQLTGSAEQPARRHVLQPIEEARHGRHRGASLRAATRPLAGVVRCWLGSNRRSRRRNALAKLGQIVELRPVRSMYQLCAAAGRPDRAAHPPVHLGPERPLRLRLRLDRAHAVAAQVAECVEDVPELCLDHVDHRGVAEAGARAEQQEAGSGSRPRWCRGRPRGCPARRRRGCGRRGPAPARRSAGP